MLSSIIGISKWWNRKQKEDFNLHGGIRESLRDEMLPKFSESMSMLAQWNKKWEIGKGKVCRMGKSLANFY